MQLQASIIILTALSDMLTMPAQPINLKGQGRLLSRKSIHFCENFFDNANVTTKYTCTTNLLKDTVITYCPSLVRIIPRICCFLRSLEKIAHSCIILGNVALAHACHSSARWHGPIIVPRRFIHAWHRHLSCIIFARPDKQNKEHYAKCVMQPL